MSKGKKQVAKSQVDDTGNGQSDEKRYKKNGKLHNTYYEKELLELQEELVKLQYWVRTKNLKAAIIFEGRDAAGKGGTINAFREYLKPRHAQVVALS